MIVHDRDIWRNAFVAQLPQGQLSPACVKRLTHLAGVSDPR